MFVSHVILHRLWWQFLSLLSTNLASAYSLSNASCFESGRQWPLKLRVLVDSGQPEAELVGKVVASASGSIALYERCCSEVFET